MADHVAKEIRSLVREGSSVSHLFRETMRRVETRVPVDGWCGLTLDPATLFMTGGVHEHGLTPTAIQRLLEIEHGEDDVLLFSALARAPSPVGVLSQATSGELGRSVRYRDVLDPSGYAHELRAALRSMKHTWGGLVLMRRSESRDFDQKDVAFLREIAEVLGDALRASLLISGGDAGGDRAILMIGPQREILSASHASSRWLADLAEDGPPDPDGLPHTVQSVMIGARNAKKNGESVSSQVRARGRSGQWLTVQATVLGDDKVVVTIEPGRPIEVASLILDAYGLSPREGEIIRNVLHGFDTEQIAELLDIKPYTVQDHLKSIFDKVGVSSRKELVGKLFFAHYLGPMREGASVGANGWFVRAPRS